MEQMTVLVMEALLKIHHMVVEVFNGHGCLDGRVFNGQCVILDNLFSILIYVLLP